ncbi:MAG TPA: glucan biosynthesis protein, partial [Desulfatiglandales bacterium]|nr:glucan biosynthesis protein [Desulfatiglandales bacterium]
MAHSILLHRAQKKLRTLLVLMLVAGNLILLPGLLLAAESKEAFGLQSVINKAQDLSKKPFQERQTLVPEFLTKMKFDDWRDIRFDSEQ